MMINYQVISSQKIKKTKFSFGKISYQLVKNLNLLKKVKRFQIELLVKHQELLAL